MIHFNIPQKLADNLIEYIDLDYLKNRYSQHTSEDYLSSVSYMNQQHFTIEWSGGGTYGSCFSDDLTEIIPEEEPVMANLNKFLEKYYPNLCVEDRLYIENYIIEKYENDCDYYGGSTVSYSKSLSIENLAEALALTVHKDEDTDVYFYHLLQEHSEIISDVTYDTYHRLYLKKKLGKELSDTNDEVKKMKI